MSIGITEPPDAFSFQISVLFRRFPPTSNIYPRRTQYNIHIYLEGEVEIIIYRVYMSLYMYDLIYRSNTCSICIYIYISMFKLKLHYIHIYMYQKLFYVRGPQRTRISTAFPTKYWVQNWCFIDISLSYLTYSRRLGYNVTTMTMATLANEVYHIES